MIAVSGTTRGLGGRVLVVELAVFDLPVCGALLSPGPA